MTATIAARVSPFAVFRRRSFVNMWVADFVSTAGNALTMLAAGILVFRETGSASSLGLLLAVTSLPGLLIGLVAGVFVDRYDRKKIMVASDLIRGVLVLLIPVLAESSIIWLYVIVFITGSLNKFFQPAHESVLPELAPDEELAAANSFMAISGFGSTAIGFAASGLIASAASIQWAFWLDGLTFFISASAIFLAQLPSLTEEGESSVGNVLGNLKEGWGFLFGNDVLRSSFVVGIFVFLSFGLWNALLLPFATRALQADEFVYGLQEGLTSVGFVLGSFLMAAVADRLREGQWFSLGIVTMGFVGVAYSQARNIPLAISFVFITGFLNALMFVGRRLIFQRNTTREVRGRVSSAYIVTGDALLIIGMTAGGLADIFDVRVMMLLASVVLVAAGGVSFVMPGLGQPAAEWRRAISLLRGAETAPGLAAGRVATLADLDALALRLRAVGALGEEERRSLVSQARVTEAEPGTAIVKRGESSDEAYFIIEGKAVAGRNESGAYRVLEKLSAGDFFGEIAAITQIPRTANVIVEEQATLLRVPADGIHKMMENHDLNRIFLTTMTERMVRMNMIDLPKFTGVDEATMRELRTTPAIAGD